MAWKEVKSALAPGNYYDSLIWDVGSQVKKTFVPEMNRGQVVGEIMKYTCCDIIPYNQTDGEIIHPNTIREELRRRLCCLDTESSLQCRYSPHPAWQGYRLRHRGKAVQLGREKK